MDWRGKVELFEQIRREYEFGVGTISGVAKKLSVHRGSVALTKRFDHCASTACQIEWAERPKLAGTRN